MEWNEDLSVGVKEIDNQHQEFIRILNRSYVLVEKAKDQNELEAILTLLRGYAVNHFSTEEKYFDLFQYEFADEHKAEHGKMLQKITDFKVRFKQGEYDLIFDLIGFLENWLADHVEMHDKKYMKCFSEHGLR